MPDKDAIRAAAVEANYEIKRRLSGPSKSITTYLESIIRAEVERKLKDAYEAIAMLVAHNIGEMKAGPLDSLDHLPDVIRRLGP